MAVHEADTRQSYEITGLRDDAEYVFRLYSSTDARRSQSSVSVVIRTPPSG